MPLVLYAVQEACIARPGCVAFVWDNTCGYLKTSAGPVTAKLGYTVFTRRTDIAAAAPAPVPAP
jgi:hypothetical protein